MKKFTIKKSQLLFLLENINNPAIKNVINSSLNNQTNNDGIYSIQLSDSDLHELAQSLADLLTDIGMKNAYELNEIGYNIEKLIDIFNPYV